MRDIFNNTYYNIIQPPYNVHNITYWCIVGNYMALFIYNSKTTSLN